MTRRCLLDEDADAGRGSAPACAAPRRRSCSTSRRTRMAKRTRNRSSTTPRPGMRRGRRADAAPLFVQNPPAQTVCAYDSCPIYMVTLEAALVVLAEEVAVRVGLLRAPAEEDREHEAAHAEQRVALAHVLDAQSQAGALGLAAREGRERRERRRGGGDLVRERRGLRRLDVLRRRRRFGPRRPRTGGLRASFLPARRAVGEGATARCELAMICVVCVPCVACERARVAVFLQDVKGVLACACQRCEACARFALREARRGVAARGPAQRAAALQPCRELTTPIEARCFVAH